MGKSKSQESEAAASSDVAGSKKCGARRIPDRGVGPREGRYMGVTYLVRSSGRAVTVAVTGAATSCDPKRRVLRFLDQKPECWGTWLRNFIERATYFRGRNEARNLEAW